MSGRHTVRLALGTLLAGVAFVLSACAPDAAQDALDPAGPFARTIDDLFNLVFWIAAGVFVLVEGLLILALVKFRHKRDAPVPVQVHGNRRLELGWTVAPALLLAIIAVPTVGTIFSIDRRPEGNVLDISVTGLQWWWHVEYPNLQVVTANEFHIPVDVPVRISLTAPPERSNGVIHSFWIPRLAGKQDLFPGRITHLNIEADEPGLYEGQCVEFCGLSHANMQLAVVAETQGDFDAWVEAQRRPAPPPPPDVLAIMQGVSTPCGGCHTINGVEGFGGRIGPDLTHFADRSRFAGWMFENTPENLAAWIRDAPSRKPGSVMPSFAGELSQGEVDALVAYLRSLE
jgi:cytochrome c oxidase subunit II